MARRDISDFLIHFTTDESIDAAFHRLRKIMSDRRLIAGAEKIRGKYPCVCFSEAPLPSLSDGLVNSRTYSRYSPFGIMFDKRWIFAKGGRPVIYQPAAEFKNLPESLRWRHVTYEPVGDPPVDFTWEREWRVRRDYLDFSPREAWIVLLDTNWAKRLTSEHAKEQDYKVMQYSLILDDDTAELYREPFPWRIVTLRT